jgi:hypothetical protein
MIKTAIINRLSIRLTVAFILAAVLGVVILLLKQKENF